ncbi:GIY-YIG nuclease family protein [Planomicrobium okeanokoites]|uniref:GIY-YIG nuclease family protein n=1 Tax=Planomicrobium okeanokoites TaxID=244 RepID=A0ABV7KML4_PLAOK|nr:GIY-YIG nuclease family protein [Planomicrobium okeanokoites]TAA66033.1 GIY-YIG nuclease family protein [Planomicrobium okeanokoites]
METNSHYFYVLECADNSYYAGYTNDLQKRLETHNAGKGAKYTRARGPVKMIHSEEFETKPEAMKAEYAFKQLTKVKKIRYIAEGKEQA